MKTIKKGDQIKRVKDKEAMILIDHGWNYVSKSEWKKNRTESKKKK